MSHSEYVNLYDISELQTEVMEIVCDWGRKKKKPIPRTKIIREMTKRKVGYFAVNNAINFLLKNGYIRRAVITSNKSYYVQLRTLKR